MNLEGKLEHKWGKIGTKPGEFRGPTGIDTDAQGCVYVVDTQNQRIQKFDPPILLL